MPRDDSFNGLGGLQTLLTEDGEPEVDLVNRRSDDLAPGEVVDRYVVEALLGRGGVATVYRVRHTKLATTHALKLLNSPGGRLTERLLAEGRLLAPWRHPNIVRVQDAFEAKGGLALLMELVDGPTLAQWLEDNPKGLEPEIAEALFRQILGAVKYAHQQDVIHRDLKTSNIILEAHEDHRMLAKVTDFGIAKILGEQIHSMLTDTRTGALLGTPAYMAPEQIDGASRVDERADLFALGVILYEMCSGSRPFEGASVWALLEALRQVSHIPIQERAPRTPPHLVRAIEACLIRDPAHRVPNTDTLEEILDGGSWQPPVQQSPVRPTVHTTPPVRTSSIPKAVFAAGVLALGAITILAAAATHQQDQLATMREKSSKQEVKNRALRAAREHADMERLAWKTATKNPAKALALLRALAVARGTSERFGNRGEIFSLMSKGGATLTIPAHDQISKVAFSHETRLLAALFGEGDIAVWEVETGTMLFKKNANVGTSHRAISFTHGGTRIVVSHAGGEHPEHLSKPARVFDARTGEVINTFAHGKRTFGFSYSKDERLGATSDFLTGIQIWDMQTGGPIRKLEHPHTVTERGIAFSGDARFFAALDRTEEKLFVFRVSDWKLLHTLAISDGHGSNLSFSSDSQYLVAKRGGMARAWDAETGELRGEWRAPEGFLLSTGLERVLAGSQLGGVTLLSLPSLAPIKALDGHNARTLASSLLEQYGLALTASSDHTAQLWSSKTGEHIETLRGHTSWVLDGLLFLDRNTPHVLTGGRDKVIKVWTLPDMGTRREYFSSSPSKHRAWSEDGKVAAIVDEAGHVWLKEDTREPVTFDPGATIDDINRLTLLPKERVVVLSPFLGSCQLYNFEGRHIATVAHGHGNNSQRCYGATRKDDNTLLFSFTHDIFEVDPNTWKIKGVIAPNTSNISLHNAQWNAIARKGIYRRDRHALVFLNERNEPEKTHKGEQYSISQIHSLKNSPSAIVTHWYPKVERWNLSTMELEWSNRSFQDGLSRSVVSPDEKLLAVGSPDSSVHILNVETGELLRSLRGHEMDIWSLAFSRDGDLLASSSKDGTVRVWSVETGELLDLFPAHGSTTRLRFMENGDLVGWAAAGGFYTWNIARMLEEKRDWLAWTGKNNNYRVCRGSWEVVAVTPFPAPSTVWAPDASCPSSGKKEHVIE
jgi:serine/threonine-protein kinase